MTAAVRDRTTISAAFMVVVFGVLGLATAAEAVCALAGEAEHLRRASVVFEGRALDGPATTDGVLYTPARFVVSDYLKGEGPAVVEVTTAVSDEGGGMISTISVGIAPRAGERWRIYGSRPEQGGPLLASECSGSVRLVAATDGSGDGGFDLVAEAVPGFGGAWVEGDGGAGEDETLHLWLTEPNEEAEQRARSLLVELVGDRFDQAAIVVHMADFPWDRLQEWFLAVADVHNLPGVVFTDADETINRVVIGVEDPKRHEPAIRQWLADREIPPAAVVVTQSDPIRTTAGDPRAWPQRFLTGPTLVALAGIGLAAAALWRRWRASTTGHDLRDTASEIRGPD